MGDAADDAYDAATRRQEDFDALLTACEDKLPDKGRRCEWDVNEDGIYECVVCGATSDL